MGLVVAPAGWGKTSLLSQFAAAADVPTAWYRADHWDGGEPAFLSHLAAAVAPVLGEQAGSWHSVEDALNAMADWRGSRALLVVDDLHALEGTPAETAFGRIVTYLPPNVTVLAASRTWPALNLPRLRVSEALVEVDADALRFRSWEVERLFRDLYREAITPEEVAQLARRTGGWAAGLQLFHIAARGKPPDERRRMLEALGGRTRMIREYLTTNVLEELPAELRDFLVETCVLGRLTAPLCDRLLQSSGSQTMLDELERRQLVGQLADGAVYRSHDVLRAHLEVVLVDRRGEAQARQRFRRAGMLLEAAGALPEALRAYSRAESWSAVERLLAGHGERLIQGRRVWMEVLPASLAQHDPWLLLATARQHRDEGRWAEAVDAYQRAERLSAGADAELICFRERRAVAAWQQSAPPPRVDWSTVVRSAVVRDPLAALVGAPKLSPVEERLATGLIHLLTGQLATARAQLTAAAESPGAGPTIAAGARLGAAVAALLAGDAAGERELDWIIEGAERAGLTWLGRLGRSLLALTSRGDAASECAAVRLAFERNRDELSGALAALAQGAAWLQGGGQGSTEGLEQAALCFQRMNAGVLEAWARGLLALAMARAGDEGAAAMALRAERLATASGTAGAAFFAYVALSLVDPERAARYREMAHAVQARTGLAAGFAVAVVPEPVPAPGPSMIVRCFGGLSISIDGGRVDLGPLKPRARTLLRLLAMNAARPVHRETLQEALWPDMDADCAARNLHVAVHALRRVLEPSAGRGASRILVRDGDAYRLVLPEDGELDLARFERTLREGERARAEGDAARAAARLREALDLYTGDLLPEDGPADWVVERRERYRWQAVRAAQHLAELQLALGELAAAADVAEAGLRLERYHDPLWRTLIEAHERSGAPGAAARARRDYQRTLAELGLSAELSGPGAVSSPHRGEGTRRSDRDLSRA